MAQRSDDIVTEFLLGMFPVRFLAAYRVVGELTYPIPDRHSFNAALAERESKGDNEMVAGIKLLTAVFQPVDFPLQTPRGALEKLHDRLFGDSRLPSFAIPDPPAIEDPEIDPVIDFREVFPEPCASVANTVYGDCLAHGSNVFDCYSRARLAGERCFARLSLRPARPIVRPFPGWPSSDR